MLPVKRDFHIAHTAPFPRRGVFPVAHLSVDPSSKIKLNEDDTTFLQTSGETRPTIMRIGVLALQGDFDAHRRRLESGEPKWVPSKSPSNSTISTASSSPEANPAHSSSS